MADGEVFKYFGNFLFPNVFKTFRIAIQPSRLLTAFAGVVVVFISGWLMDFTGTVVVSGDVTRGQLQASGMSGSLVYPSELHCYVQNPAKVGLYVDRYQARNEGLGVFKVFGNYLAGRFNNAVEGFVTLRFDLVAKSVAESVSAFGWALRYHTWYSVIFFLIVLVSFSVVGGAICRGAALHFSRDEKPTIGECLRFSSDKFISLLFAPLAPVIFVLTVGMVFIFLPGLLTNIPWVGEILMSIMFIAFLFFAAGITITIIYTVAGGGLLFPIVAYEGSDTFDSTCKTYLCVYKTPWRLFFYTFLGLLYGAICYLFVRFFAFVLLTASRWFLELSVWVEGSKSEQMSKVGVIWPEPEFFNLFGSGVEIARNGTEAVAAGVVYLAVAVVAGLVGAFVVSFYFSMNTVIYSLLRKKIDDVDISKVYVDADEEDNGVNNVNEVEGELN